MHVDGNGDIGYIVHRQEGGCAERRWRDVELGDVLLVMRLRMIRWVVVYGDSLMAVYRVREGFVGGGGRLTG